MTRNKQMGGWMQIRFGMVLDGARSTLPSASIGQVALGPLGLVSLLELYLGLTRPEVTQAQRAVRYRTFLKSYLADHPHAFFARSFAADEVGVATAILRWRDQWYDYGWSGEPAESLSGRLSEIAEIEQRARAQVPPGQGERLMMIEAAFAAGGVTPIEELLCLTPEHHLSPRWAAVLRRLPTRFRAPEPQAPAGTRLHQVQCSISEPGTVVTSLPNDGSLLVVKAGSSLLSGAWLATRLRRDRDTLLLVEEDAQALDDLLTAQGLPVLGFADNSALRPALQSLPLALQQLWKPADIHGLLAFLTHPFCPARSMARGRIAESLAQKPGLDPIRMEALFTKIRADIEERNQGQPDHLKPIDADRVLQEASYWLFGERFDPDQGAPILEIRNRVERLAAYFRGRMSGQGVGAIQSDTQTQSLGAGHAQCQALLDSLGQLLEQGEKVLLPRALQKLVRQASSRGARPPGRSPEVGAYRVASDPAAVVEGAEEVIWWNLKAPSALKGQPWTRRERAELAKAGILLPTEAERLQQLQHAQILPLLNARQSLILVMAPGESEIHPLLQQILSRFPVITPLPLQNLLAQAEVSEWGVTTEAVEYRPLPSLQRWWKLPAGSVPWARESKDSFSSLELYLGAPHRWVLRYPARIKPSQLLEIADGPLLLGTLLHDVVETVLNNYPDCLKYSAQEITTVALKELDALIEREAMILLAPGRGSDLGRLKVQTARAVEQLWSSMRAADVVRAEPEAELEGRFGNGEVHLQGYADLVLTRADGGQAIVDMKWGSADKRQTQLKSNTHLQLILYSGLLAQRGGADSQWADVAYYILSKQKLLAQDQRYFPDAAVNGAKDLVNAPALWQAAERSWAWRRAQLKAGEIEVVSEAIDVDPDDEARSTPPEGAYAPPQPEEGFDEYRYLKGWGR